MAKTEDAFSPINSLPPDCISHIISLASPRDACMFSLTSTAFRSVIDTDDTWQRFLPLDYASILSRAVNPVEFSSKKDLLVKLCKHPVLIDGGKMSFGLDRFTGKKCYMISARALDIDSANEAPDHWRWISSPDSRFDDVAKKVSRCHTNIYGKIESNALCRKTRYSAYLIYKVETLTFGRPIRDQIMLRTFVNIGGHVSTGYVCLKNLQKYINKMFDRFRDRYHCTTPKERGDGWMEVEIGEFYNENGEEGEIRMGLEETGGRTWGLIVQGIEIRPKH
ncbi:F-box protein [Rhynchospora pubera]|uniref:F-box protein n=1 Tax=Rhynchospora pubera TaxID=906938 RepID=A0AAV8E463_9POAL|nr:F-box protein [Rhynchospora pubera]